jgi:hypothetical protein
MYFPSAYFSLTARPLKLIAANLLKVGSRVPLLLAHPRAEIAT